MSSLKGNILITGASRGIGCALVRALLKCDGVKRIFAGCRNPVHAYNLQEFGSSDKLKLVKFSVPENESIDSVFDEIFDELNGEGLDMLINTAAIFEEEGGSHNSPERNIFLKHFDVNSVSPVLVTQKFMPLLVKAAQEHKTLVINLSSSLGSSTLAKEGYEMNIVYGMSKAALNNYTAVISKIHKDSNIIIISICPGPIYKDVTGSSLHPGISLDESAAEIINTITKLNIEDTGKFIDRFGTVIPF